MLSLSKGSALATGTALLTLAGTFSPSQVHAITFTGNFTLTVTTSTGGGYLGSQVGDITRGSFSYDGSAIPTSGFFSQPLLSFDTFSPSFVPSSVLIFETPPLALFDNGVFLGLDLVGLDAPVGIFSVFGIYLDSFSGSERFGGFSTGTVAYSVPTPATSIPEPASTIGLFLLGGWLLRNKISSSRRSTPATVGSEG